MATRQKRAPYLAGYLKFARETLRKDQGPSPNVAGCVIVAIAYPLLLAMAIRIFGPIFGNGIALAGAVLAGIVTAQIGKSLHKSRRPSEREVRALEVAVQLEQLQSSRKLHKSMDPAVLQILEAAAYHWTRVQTALGQTVWKQEGLPEHWKVLHGQASLVSREAMVDLLILSSGAVGAPARDKEAELKDVFEDICDLDIADALQGLKSVTTSSWQDYAHVSPLGQDLFHQARPIAERLQSLADELEAVNIPKAIDLATSNAGQSTKSLDAVLADLKAIRQAENELEQRVQP